VQRPTVDFALGQPKASIESGITHGLTEFNQSNAFAPKQEI